MNYIERLKSEVSQKRPPAVLTKPTEPPFVSSVSSANGGESTNLDRNPGEESGVAADVTANMQAGIPTLVNMGALGRAYWVATDRQRAALENELRAKDDDTPVFSWGELVVMYCWDDDMNATTYELKRRFTGQIQNPRRPGGGL